MKSNSAKRTSHVAAAAREFNPKWAWHYRTLQKLRDGLAEEQSAKLFDVSQPLEPHSMDEADSATDEFEHSLALSEISARETLLLEINEALDRIQNDTYGVCLISGKPISSVRLRAVPWTRFSKEIADRLERQGDIKSVRLGQVGSVRGTAGGSLTKAEFERLEAERILSAEETI